MAKALLAKGDKKKAAGFKELPLNVRRRPDVDPLMEQAGVPRTFGTFMFRGNFTGKFLEAVPVTSWSKGGKKLGLDLQTQRQEWFLSRRQRQ